MSQNDVKVIHGESEQSNILAKRKLKEALILPVEQRAATPGRKGGI